MGIGIKNPEKIKAAVVGASGYTGLELMKILIRHRCTEIILATSSTFQGRPVCEVFPLFHEKKLTFISTDVMTEKNFSGADVVFLCLPSPGSMDFVKKHLQNYEGAIIDIGSDFRIKNPCDFRQWYGKDHMLADMLDKFVYGLPEINHEKIKSSKYIANPGCYATSVILALAPLLDPQTNKYFEILDINIDSKSGVSGAGRKLTDQYLFCSLNENFYAYSPVLHRHIGEIEQELESISGRVMKVCFTPHLLPVDRGIFTSIYCIISPGRDFRESNRSQIDDTPEYAAEDNERKPVFENKNSFIINSVIEIFRQYYKNSFFIRFTGQTVPQIKDVAGTNFCHVGFAYDERTDNLKLFSVIDNLVKGAAGQAVQNMNIIFNFDQQEGLDW